MIYRQIGLIIDLNKNRDGGIRLEGISAMKYFGIGILVLAISVNSLFGQTDSRKYELPALNVISTITLSPSYSCRALQVSQKGYETTAIFLSGYSKQRNSPDLLFNGACGSDDYFDASLAGDDFSLIADLGTQLSFEQLSAAKVFNPRRIHAFNEYSKFARVAKVQSGHVYAVVLNDSSRRGMFVFRVVEHVPNVKAVLSYAVKNYYVVPNGSVRAEGFGWEKPNN